MARLTKKDMQELREFCAWGCDYSGTEEEILESATEAIREIGFDEYVSIEDVVLDYIGETQIGLTEFVRVFYEKVAEKILNVVSTQGQGYFKG